jgi:hypothetical protein
MRVIPALGLVALSAIAATAQTSATITRTADGHPDMQGIWANDTVTPLERPRRFAEKDVLSEREAKEYENDVTGRWRDKFGDLEVTTSGELDDVWQEYGKVTPTRRTSLMILQIVQTSQYVVIFSELMADLRIVRMSAEHQPHAIRQWLGDSIARWDGDTLVIETTNLNGKMWLDSAGNFIGPNAKVTERIRLVSPNFLDYSATIDDPETFTRPFTLRAPQRRQRAADAKDPYAAESWEHACHEGNGEHEQQILQLGFKWYLPPAAPAK